MEILFLGTSSGWPLPRLGCKCAICSSLDPRDKRSRPSLLINDSILLDAPIDIYQSLVKYGVNPTKISHLIITHPHDDHIFGLYDLSHIYQKDKKIALISTKGVISSMGRLMGTSMRSFQIKEVRPFEKFALGNDSFAWLIPVEHGSIETYGIKVKAFKPIFYAPEFRRILPSSRRELGDIDLAILDGSSKTSYGQAMGHETIEEGIRLGNDIKAKRVLFTNIGHKTDKQSALDAFVKERGGDKFAVAFDGLVIKV
jgi:phosphoribosyl 1,2-cyclic phosphate phosphodiesterase